MSLGRNMLPRGIIRLRRNATVSGRPASQVVRAADVMAAAGQSAFVRARRLPFFS